MAVTEVLKISDGLVLAARGEVLFHVSYRAVLFRPVKDEVVDAIVKTVAKVGYSAVSIVSLSSLREKQLTVCACLL